MRTNKTSFILLELLLVILILSLLYNSFVPKKQNGNLKDLKRNLTLQMKYLRYQALIESKYNLNENKWFKKLWTIKFQRCRKSVGGFYYSIYSDRNMQGHINREETLKDPLSNKYIYANNYCKENSKDSKYTLLTKNYNVEKINISCNNTNSIGQISYDYYSNIYTKLGERRSSLDTKALNSSCKIEFIDKYANKEEIYIEKNTGYIR